MKKNLQTIYLRLDSSSKSLTKRALAQLLLKIIYFLDIPPSRTKITGELASILGTKINSLKINDALNLLLTDNKILESNGKYSITPSKKGSIETAVNEFENRQKKVISKYFSPLETPENFVTQWFEEVTIEFFNEYSSEWVSDLSLTTTTAVRNKHRGLNYILDSVTASNKQLLEKDKDFLKLQYLKFLHSNDNDVSAILWDYGTSKFSSSLIIANTSADPITIDEFSNSKCILDTNILMYLDLEISIFKDSFKSMENIFANLNISPVYFPHTREEYIAAIDWKRNDTLRVVENYPFDVVCATDDPFIQTAIFRECKTQEEFINFFDQLIDIPAYFSDYLKLNMEITSELETAILNGNKNEQLLESINKVYFRKRNKDKKKSSLVHDAGLISGAKFLRTSEKCFILSRDSSINEAALEYKNANEIPIAIGLDTLINLLAIYNGGTDIDPRNCAPLFASIIKLALIPEQDVFKLEDLSRMLDVETQIANLPTEEIIDIAKELHHNNVTGVSDEDSSLQLTRRFQSAKIQFQTDLDKQKQQTYFEKEEKEKYIESSIKTMEVLRNEYKGNLMKKYDNNLFKNRILFFVVLPILTIILFGMILFNNSEKKFTWNEQGINLGINIIAWFIVDFLIIGKKLRSSYTEKVNEINEQVERKIKENTN